MKDFARGGRWAWAVGAMVAAMLGKADLSISFWLAALFLQGEAKNP